MFHKYSNAHNHGISVGFIKSFECRMAGKHIALCWILQLQDALHAAINLVEFIELRNFKQEMSVVQLEEFGNIIHHVSCIVCIYESSIAFSWPKIPAMDKLHFYVCQTYANLFKYLKKASADAQLCTYTRILSLMSTWDKGIDDDEDKEVLSSENNQEDSSNSESSVENKSDGEDIEDKESKEVPTDNEDHDVNFVNETIGACCGQLRQVHYIFINILSPLLHVSMFYSPLQIGRSAELLVSFPGMTWTV